MKIHKILSHLVDGYDKSKKYYGIITNCKKVFALSDIHLSDKFICTPCDELVTCKRCLKTLKEQKQ